MSSHAANTCGLDASAFLKSAGTSCTTPLEIFFCDIDKLSFRKPQWRRSLAEQNMCGSFGHGDVLTLRISPRSCDAKRKNATTLLAVGSR